MTSSFFARVLPAALLLAGCGGDDSPGTHDSGTGAHDAGPTAHDAGPTPTDSGPPAMDAGPSPTDAGPPPVDASQPPDAGPERACMMDMDCAWGEIDHEILRREDCVCLFGCPTLPLSRATVDRRNAQY